MHTFFSECGLHSVLEMANHARSLGLKRIAITDHGKLLDARVNGTFFMRFENPFDDIKILKGIELNLADKNGKTDIPMRYIHKMDVVLFGMHYNYETGLSIQEYTQMVINAIKTNPFIDIITHPNSVDYPLNYNELAKEAAKYGVALELNNSKTHYKKIDDQNTKSLIQACIDANCKMVVNSDAHAVMEIGRDESVMPFLKELNFPENLLLNSSVEKVDEFLAERKVNKLGYPIPKS
ncbi:MAG: PHP domain-containing protein [Verrucomicrobiota bacterium]|nr:PHP domain-containing protein [Verrucomicrobiota bacterium]